MSEGAEVLRSRFPITAYNLTTLLGVAVALVALAAIVIIFLLDLFAPASNPYIGILVFVIFPAVLVAGLLLIPLGMWRERRRLERGAAKPLVIDLANPGHRNAIVTFVVGTCVFLLVSTIGLYQGYQYMESSEFCGEACHAVMEPERITYHVSPHARVECVECHIGPGAGWFVRSKLSGTRQVFKTVLGTYPRPIPTPIEHLRPAQETCEQCHWPEKFFASRAVRYHHFLGNRDNTAWVIDLRVHVGGTAKSPHERASGIHWHIDPDNHMTYVAADSSRQTIDQVTWWRDGTPIVFSRGGTPLGDSVLARRRARGLERGMDCIDCHNRPAHHYRSPVEAVNEALAAGQLDPRHAWVKRAAVQALSQRYASPAGARDSIVVHLRAFYAEVGGELPAGVSDAVRDLYERNFFPAMRANWSRYPENSGHFESAGCFRCHGSEMTTADGTPIRKDCNLCHEIAAQGPPAQVGNLLAAATGLEFQHPVDVGGAEREMSCSECHKGDAGLFEPIP
jgi:hypothetical protein